jgi:hypothetical protein
MVWRGFFEADDEGPQVGKSQPMRHHPAQDAPFLEHRSAGAGASLSQASLSHASLAGDHQDDAMAAGLRATQESDQGEMGLLLPHPVQVDGSVDRAGAPPQGLQCPASPADERRGGGDVGGRDGGGRG